MNQRSKKQRSSNRTPPGKRSTTPAQAERGRLNPREAFGPKRIALHKVGRPLDEDAGVSHLKREVFTSRSPVHVVLQLRSGLRSLRTKKPHETLRRAFTAGRDRFGFRLVHYSIRADHLHFIVEADDRKALTRGMMGLSIRIGKALNQLWGRQGKIFADRYFDRVLHTPLEVRNALRHVLENGDHGAERPDIFSSGMHFDGWREQPQPEDADTGETPPVAPARTSLLRRGWRRHGLLSLRS